MSKEKQLNVESLEPVKTCVKKLKTKNKWFLISSIGTGLLSVIILFLGLFMIVGAFEGEITDKTITTISAGFGIMFISFLLLLVPIIFGILIFLDLRTLTSKFKEDLELKGKKITVKELTLMEKIGDSKTLILLSVLSSIPFIWIVAYIKNKQLIEKIEKEF